MEEIAVVYARSLFEAALDADKLDVVREQIGELADALDQDRQLQVFFFSPYFSSQEKKDGIDQAIRNAIARANKTVRNLDWFEVGEIRGYIEEGSVSYTQVALRVGFRLEDPA